MFVLKKGKWRLILTLIVFLLLQCNGKILRLVDSRSVIMAANKQIPSSPVYSEDGKQVTFDNIYFGSYPQTEVKDNDLTSSILTASYDTYGDAWVNGTKYRRIRISDTNNVEHFGNRAYRYFKWERVKWRVLDNDGDT